MPAYEIIIQVLKDGVNIGGFPFRRTLETNEGTEYNVVKADGDVTPQPFPTLVSGQTLQLFVASSDEPVTFVAGGVTAADGLIQMLAGGLLLMFNVNQNAAAGTQVQVENSGSSSANIKGAWGGN